MVLNKFSEVESCSFSRLGALARELKAQECSQYAGFCCLAQARCEHTLANAPGEAQALTNAARSFLKAEIDISELRCPSFKEHLNAAINCYSHAIRVHVENKQPALAAALSIEVGDALRSLNRSSEAISHYQRAAELQYQPTPQRIRPEHAQTLEKYAWQSTEEDPVVSCFSEDLFLLLQSIVMACQSKDLESLNSLQVELWPLLSAEQNHLLHLVIQELTHPAGEGV
ncbi:hypothetical protein LSH36_208g01049 [Paralvinella palmiformis]|uniref:Factor VIII intron 22 protein n=1 Tax=Paralvinella palmiformis TaxID=53620 RepID=A0AAD9JNR8_9ANNE|nr:hypothetical protein LSH36_208g01049 [Paralvinella palmiformis]